MPVNPYRHLDLARRRELVAAGLCQDGCGNPCGGYSRCEACRARRVARSHTHRQYLSRYRRKAERGGRGMPG